MTSRRHRRQYCAPDVSGCAHTECTHGFTTFRSRCTASGTVPCTMVPYFARSVVSERSIIVHVRHDSALIMCRCMCLVCRLSTVRFSSFHCTLFKFTPLLDMPAYIHEHAFIPTHTFAHGAFCNLHSLCFLLCRSQETRDGDGRREQQVCSSLAHSQNTKPPHPRCAGRSQGPGGAGRERRLRESRDNK